MIKRNYKYYLAAMMLLSPAAIIYVIFLITPLIQSVQMSFFDWNGIAGSPMEFVGFNNFKIIFKDADFYRSLINSGWFIVGSFVVQMPIAFSLALIITSKIKGVRIYKTAFFMPVILPITAVGLMWKFILYPNGGLLNTILTNMQLGGLTRNWLADPKIAIISIVLVNMWIYAGLNMLIFAAGMTNIPDELYEAARIDGADGFNRIRYITIPMLKSTFVIFSVLAITGSLRTFDLVFVMTGGGPNGASYVPALYLYNEAFKYNHYGVGNAIGTFILFAGMGISALITRSTAEK